MARCPCGNEIPDGDFAAFLAHANQEHALRARTVRKSAAGRDPFRGAAFSRGSDGSVRFGAPQESAAVEQPRSAGVIATVRGWFRRDRSERSSPPNAKTG